MFFFSVIGAIQMRYDDDDDTPVNYDCNSDSDKNIIWADYNHIFS